MVVNIGFRCAYFLCDVRVAKTIIAACPHQLLGTIEDLGLHVLHVRLSLVLRLCRNIIFGQRFSRLTPARLISVRDTDDFRPDTTAQVSNFTTERKPDALEVLIPNGLTARIEN